MTKNDTGIDSM